MKEIKNFNMGNLPDIMYFSSKDKFNTIKSTEGRLFLSPYIGISSMFIIDKNTIMRKLMKDKLGKEPTRYTYNISYEEWTSLSNRELSKPLEVVHMYHNIKELTNKDSGISRGFIYELDISSIKNELKLFITNDANREVIYTGNKEFKPKRILHHTLKWFIEYNQKNSNVHGYGKFE